MICCWKMFSFNMGISVWKSVLLVIFEWWSVVFTPLLQSSAGVRLLAGLAALFEGSYLEGWTLCEARFELPWGQMPDLDLPRFNPSACSHGCNLVVVAEPGQGFGDLFWMLRFMPWLKREVSQVSFVGAQSLLPLIRASGLFEQSADCIQDLSVRPTHCLPSMSAPHVLGCIDPVEFPNPAINLNGSAQRLPLRCQSASSSWERQSLPVVALNWQGNHLQESPMSAGIRGRSFSIEQLEQLDALSGCVLLSVQVGDASQRLADSWLKAYLDPSQVLLDRPNRDFLTTADALLQSDLLITNATSVAHLGGLLNVPTWVVLKCHPYWQWGDSGQRNVWYPTVRCFRQHRPGDWSSAIADVNQALKQWLSGGFSPPGTRGSRGL